MESNGISEAREWLRGFRFVDPFWSGTAFVPFWGSELDINIYPLNDGFTSRQRHFLRAILDYATDIKPAFEKALVDYYQADVVGSYCACTPEGIPIPDSGPPELKHPSEIWSLIDQPEVFIHCHFRTVNAIEFELSFNCIWDPEHGLGVRYQDWRPVHFGGWDL